LLSDACEYFISAIDFSSRLKSLPTVQHLIPSEAVAFVLHLAGHVAGTLSPMPLHNQQFSDALDTLFDAVPGTEVLWSQACIRAAWLIGLQNALAGGDQNNRTWLSAHGNFLNVSSFCSRSLVPVVFGTLMRTIIVN